MENGKRAALAALWGIGGLFCDPCALAQQGPLDRVEITGSLIRRIDAETALPVTVIRADELLRAGVTNAEEAILYVTQQQGGTVTSSSVSSTNGGNANAGLRYLGSLRTLVLLNGRRVVNNPHNTLSVNLNTLPVSALDRIEVLADGASSIYGADALAGVINFITRQQYKGAMVSAQAQLTEHGGGNTQAADVLGGAGDLASQGWNVYGALSVRAQDPMRGTQRSFSESAYMPAHGLNLTNATAFPANYTQVVNGVTTVVANPTSPACDPSGGSISLPEANGTRVRCFADTQKYTNAVPEQDQHSAFLRGTLALGPNHRASAEYFRAYNKVTVLTAPSPETGLSVAPDSPYYPGNGIYPAAPGLNPARPVTVNWRTTVLGPRISQQENTTQRAVASAEGSFGPWEYNAALLWSRADVTGTLLSGWPITPALRSGVRGCKLTGAAATSPCGDPLGFYLNPFGDQTAAGQAYLEANQIEGQVQESHSTLKSAQLTVSRDLFSLPGGSATVAAFVEARSEENLFITDLTKATLAGSSGLAGQGPPRQGERDVKAAGMEINLPVLRQLELNFSVRHDRYSDFGGTTNPKAAIRFRPSDNLLLRASYNTGFATPSLAQLYAPQSTVVLSTRYNDPVLCPGGVANTALGALPARDCNVQFQRLNGGNPALAPEKSRAYSLGFILQPSPQWSLGADYWHYYVKNVIDSGLEDAAIFADPVKYAQLFVRCSQAPAARAAAAPGCQQPGGDPLAYIVATNLNLGDYRTQGIDWHVNFTGPTTEAGRFTVSLRGSYVLKYEFQVEPGGAWFNPLGNYNVQFGGPVLRYQHVAVIGWQRGAWGAQLTNRYITGYTDQNGTSVTPAFRNNRVGPYSVWNLSASWKATPSLTLQAGVLNILDTDPPFSNQADRSQARGYDDRFSKPLGREYQLSARYEF